MNVKETEKLKWSEKSRNIIIMLILFYPIGLYYTWKNTRWTLETKTTIFLFLFIPLGLFFMFKYGVWTKKKRYLIVFLLLSFVIGISLIPPSIQKGVIYKFENTYDCPETFGRTFFKIKDDRTLILWSVDVLDYKKQCCKTEILYLKINDIFILERVVDTNISDDCISQFMGKYIIEDKTWTNGVVKIELSDKIYDLK